jgi:hypothetical protein
MKNHPWVTSSDQYWFGYTSALSENPDLQYSQIEDSHLFAEGQTKVTASWRVDTLPGDVITRSVVVRTSPESARPQLQMDDELFPHVLPSDSEVIVTGTVTDEDGDDQISICISLDRALALSLPVEVVVSGGSFSFSFVPESFFSPGTHSLSVYAVDSTHTVSYPMIYSFTVIAPTPCPSVSPEPTLVARTDILMEATDFYGIRITGSFPDYSQVAPGVLLYDISSGAGVIIQPYLWTIGSTLFATLAVETTAEDRQYFNLYVQMEQLYFEIYSLDYEYYNYINTISAFDTIDGFRFSHLGDIELRFLLRDHTFVSDVDSYWFGSDWELESSRFAQIEESTYVPGSFEFAAGAFSWQNRFVDPGETIHFSFVVRWGPESSPPKLDLSDTQIPPLLFLTDNIIFRGQVLDEDPGESNIRIFGVVDGDFLNRVEITSNPLHGTASIYQIKQVDSLGLTLGVHSLDLYAIDGTGTVSDDPVHFEVLISMPTPSAPRSPTSSLTPLPTATPAVFLGFDHVEVSPWDDQLWLRMDGRSAEGEVARHFFDYTSYLFSFKTQPLWPGQSFEVGYRAHAAGAAVVIGIELTSHSSVDEIINVFFRADALRISFQGSPFLPVSCFSLPDSNGFYAAVGGAQLHVLCRDYPMVVNADSYWFGEASELEAHKYNQTDQPAFSPTVDAGFIVTWANRVLRAGESLSFGLLLRWGPETVPPSLVITVPPTVALDGTLTVTGTVSAFEVAPVSVFSIPNGKVPLSIQIASDLSQESPSFSSLFTALDLGLVVGTNNLTFYAFNAFGTISAPVSFLISVTGPIRTPIPSRGITETETDSHTPTVSLPVTESPLATQTPTRTVRMSGTVRVTDTVRPTPTVSATVRPSRTVVRSSTIARTPIASSSPTASPHPIIISVESDVAVPSTYHPVLLNGSGTIRPTSDGQLILADITLPQGSDVIADRLVVLSRMALVGDSSLTAVENGAITIASSVSIVFEGDGEELPSLDLGNVGADYGIVPRSFEIVKLNREVIGNRRTLVAARSLSNCAEWIAKAQLNSEFFALECVNESDQVRVLEEGVLPRVSLELVPLAIAENPPGATPSSEGDESVVGVFLGVVGGILVAGVIVGAVVFFVTKKKGMDGESSLSEPEKEQ